MPALIAAPWLGTAIAGAAGAGATIYGAKSQGGAAKRAADVQAKSNAEALAFQREQDAEQRRQFDQQQAEAKAQWDAQQAFQERQFGASEEERLYGRAEQDARNRRRNAGLLKLGDLLGTDLSHAQYPTGDSGGSSMDAGGGMADPETQSYFSSLTAGKAPTPDTLIGLEGDLGKRGIKVLRNAAGVAGKIQLPTGQIVDVIEAAGAGGKNWQWLTGGGSPARRTMPVVPGMAPQPTTLARAPLQTPFNPVIPFSKLMQR